VGLSPHRRRAEAPMLGVCVSKTSVGTVLRRHGLPPAPRRQGPTWTQFLSAQVKGIVVTDFFHVDTVLLRRYYVLFVIEVQNRIVHVRGVTTNPNAPWVTQVARNFAADLEEAGRPFRFLIRDRETKFATSFDEVFASIGVETIRTPVRSPRARRPSPRRLTKTSRIGAFRLRPPLQRGETTSWNAAPTAEPSSLLTPANRRWHHLSLRHPRRRHPRVRAGRLITRHLSDGFDMCAGTYTTRSSTIR
jgi:hypothetical protein